MQHGRGGEEYITCGVLPQEGDYLLAQIAGDVYAKHSALPPGAFRRFTPHDLRRYGLDKAMLRDKRSGFQANFWQRQAGGAGLCRHQWFQRLADQSTGVAGLPGCAVSSVGGAGAAGQTLFWRQSAFHRPFSRRFACRHRRCGDRFDGGDI